ncbi:MAG: hypothetical protein FD164_1398 [Nitrospirae bacterium]|nr:MAG: hypothetical protein FD164_1398 [Nitrospirota bacterium]
MTQSFSLVLFRALVMWVVIACTAYGCATPVIKTIETKDFLAKLQFLEAGRTSREDVLLRLGEPSGQYEGERIFTYILAIGNEGQLHVLPRQLALNQRDPRLYNFSPSVCSLVIVFRRDGVLEKFSLVGAQDKLK